MNASPEILLYKADSLINSPKQLSFERKELNENTSLHWHDFYEIEIVIRGTGTQIFNGRNYELKRGCAYLLSPLDFHSVSLNENMEVYNFMFHESLLSESMLQMIFQEQQDRITYFDEQEMNYITSICSLFQNEYQRKYEYRDIVVRNLLECLLIMLLRKMNLQPAPKSTANAMQVAMLYMQRHFKDDPTLKETAKVANLNPNYFSQRFREITGKTYKSYLTNLKISYAEKLLLSNQFSITEICFASGFSSLSNFMKVFHKKKGMSPTAFGKATLNGRYDA